MPLADGTPRKVVFVTGLSGAGMSSALKILEDNDYEVFDNFPLSLLSPLLAEKGYSDRPIAIGLDSRTRGFDPIAIINRVKSLREQTNENAVLLYLTAKNGVLQKRFMETRRSHPQAKDRTVQDGIDFERGWMKPLLDHADQVIDTSDFSIHDLRRVVDASFNPDPARQSLAITVFSFGFKNGVPGEADMIFDVRFLKNPHWETDLRALSGHDPLVQDYVRSDEAYAPFIARVRDLLALLLPRYTSEGKHYFTLAIGCTGGQHRSVYTAEVLAKEIETLGFKASVRHRDLEMALGRR